MAHESKSARERRQRHEEIEKHKAAERRAINKIWMWIGVVILVLLLLYWIFDIGTFLGPNQ